MHDGPSDELRTRLLDAGLCRPADFVRARSHVRRWTRNLPAFDSVWIDALVRLDALSPYQARRLEVDPLDSLKCGSYRLIDEISRRPFDATYLAEPVASSPRRCERVLLREFRISRDELPATEQRVRQVIEATREFRDARRLVPPLETFVADDALYVVFSRVEGVDLRSLLVRRGRFPANVVSAILSDLLSALHRLHLAGLSHGPLALDEVLVDAKRGALLTECAIPAAIAPLLAWNRLQHPERYDGAAPEWIAEPRLPDAGSDLYAAGCLAWTLLCGRPPFLIADAGDKLHAHARQAVPDVRDVAPDTPAELAERIARLCDRDPNRRPVSSVALRASSSVASRTQLARFLHRHPLELPHLSGSRASASPRSTTAVALGIAAMVLGLAGLAAAPLAPSPWLLSLGNRTTAQADPSSKSDPSIPAGTARVISSEQEILPWPQPADDGRVSLVAGGRYRAESIQSDAPLHISGPRDVTPPRVEIADEPWILSAPSVTLERVVIERNDASAPPPIAWIKVLSTQLIVDGCRFQSNDDRSAAPSKTAIAWACSKGGRAAFRDASFDGRFAGMSLSGPARSIQFENCLFRHCHAATILAGKDAVELQLRWRRCTLRETGPALAVLGAGAEQLQHGRWNLAFEDCVLSPAADRAAFIEWRGRTTRPDSADAWNLACEGTLIGEQALPALALPAVASGAASDDRFWSVDALESMALDVATVSGLLSEPLAFEGAIDGPAHRSSLAESSVPRMTEHLPGIDAASLLHIPNGVE